MFVVQCFMSFSRDWARYDASRRHGMACVEVLSCSKSSLLQDCNCVAGFGIFVECNRVVIPSLRYMLTSGSYLVRGTVRAYLLLSAVTHSPKSQE